MRLFWYGAVLVAFYVGSEVLGEYRESIMPSKDIRRAHRTMRMNMRVGKRYGGDSEYEDEATSGWWSVADRDDHIDTKTNVPVPREVFDVIYRNDKRATRYWEQADSPDNFLIPPKRKMRMIIRTGKRTPKTIVNGSLAGYLQDTPLTPDYKRSAPQFLLNPRVGKNDKNWRILETNIEKRNDPKANDLWFGPRIGRSNGQRPENIPWNYVILNGDRLPPNVVDSSARSEPDDQADEATK